MRTEQSTWAYGPYPEDTSEQLDAFFPDRDLDGPVIDSSSSGGSSPTTAEPYTPDFLNFSADKNKKLRHKKSLRAVVAEQHKKQTERGFRSDPSTIPAKEEMVILTGAFVALGIDVQRGVSSDCALV